MKLYSPVIIAYIFISTISYSCKEKKRPVLTFEDLTKTLSINRGDIVKVTYNFKNSGNDSLIIKSVTADCGCAQIKFPSNSISPGQEGEIEVEFDSHNSKNKDFSKAILVEANTEPLLQALYLKGSFLN